jgi:phage tail-like protein
MPGSPTHPAAWRFLIEVDGIPYGEFTECTGLEATRETVPVNEGGNLTPYLLPGRVTESDIVLKRGMISTALWNWLHDGSQSGLANHRSLKIHLIGTDGNPFISWDISSLYPKKWTGPSLSADSSTLALESLELARNGAAEQTIRRDFAEESSADSSSGESSTKVAKLDIDDLSGLELERIAAETLKLMKREILFERERLGPG